MTTTQNRTRTNEAQTTTTRRRKNWPATCTFANHAEWVEGILEAALKTIRDLRFDDKTIGGYRTEADLDAIDAALGHAQMICESLSPLDGGRLVRTQL